MPKALVLIAEDDPHIRRGLADALASEGYATREAAHGLQALEQARLQPAPDLILLDIMMPEKSGYDVCRELRRGGSEVPVIILTAKGEEIDKVVGLQLGADDYVTKPFGIHELLARVEAVLRRTRPAGSGTTASAADAYAFGSARVDRRKYTVSLDGREHSLSARELTLLDLFHAHPGEVLSRDALLNAGWGIEYYGTTRTLDQHIAQLRKKVERDPAHPQSILTVHGIGYRYAGPSA